MASDDSKCLTWADANPSIPKTPELAYQFLGRRLYVPVDDQVENAAGRSAARIATPSVAAHDDQLKLAQQVSWAMAKLQMRARYSTDATVGILPQWWKTCTRLKSFQINYN